MKNVMFVLLLSICGSGYCFAQAKDYKGKDLPDADFSGKILNGADFTDADLRNAKFSNASLKNAKFTDAILMATLRGALFEKADMTGADMSGTKTSNYSFYDTNLSKSKWKKAALGGSTRCDFREADLRDCKFKASSFWSCDFRGADLRGANLIGATFEKGRENQWKGAIYDEDTAFPRGFDPEAEGMILRKPEEKKNDKK